MDCVQISYGIYEGNNAVQNRHARQKGHQKYGMIHVTIKKGGVIGKQVGYFYMVKFSASYPSGVMTYLAQIISPLMHI